MLYVTYLLHTGELPGACRNPYIVYGWPDFVSFILTGEGGILPLGMLMHPGNIFKTVLGRCRRKGVSSLSSQPAGSLPAVTCLYGWVVKERQERGQGKVISSLDVRFKH